MITVINDSNVKAQTLIVNAPGLTADAISFQTDAETNTIVVKTIAEKLNKELCKSIKLDINETKEIDTIWDVTKSEVELKLGLLFIKIPVNSERIKTVEVK